jgi:NACalpha-BTF3-like transcription factor
MNFSLLIAAMVLDFAGVLMNFFLNPFNSQSGSGGVAQALSSATQMYKVLQPPALTNNATLTQFGAATVQILANLIFADIITAVGAIVMFGLAVMFLIRYVAIGILLIILPMAIIGWVIGDKEWSKWSDKFFKQAFFGPIAAFYIYIALKSYTAIQKIVDTSNIQKALVDDPSSVVQQMGPNIASMIMVVAILMYGIKKAEDNSGYVGSWTTKAANGAINGILRGTAGTGLSATTRLFTGGKYSAEDLSKKLSNIGKNSKYKLIRGITRPLRQVGTAGKGFQENYGGLSGGLVAATVGGISEGLGFKPLELRKKEESAYKLRQDKIASMAKSWAKNAGIPEIQSAQEVEAYLNKQKDDEKESALDKTKKYFDREGNIKILMKQTGEDKETVKKALADNFDNFNEAKKELLSKKKASAGSAGGGSSTTGGESSTTSRGSNIISGTNENFQKAKEEAKKRGESFG